MNAVRRMAQAISDVRSLHPFAFGVRLLGWERFLGFYYGLAYRWVGPRGLTSFNYGYAPLSDALRGDSSVQEPFQIELYRQIAETMGSENLRGCRVLEISCGLGGGLAHLTQAFGIGMAVGADLSWQAVRWARRRFGHRVVVTDARALPFASESFDVVLNVEASHIYFSDAFVLEIKRVLKPGGLFAMSDERGDVLPPIQSGMTGAFAQHGFEVLQFRDITGNVADACRLDAPRREKILNSLPWLMRRLSRAWIGVEGAERFVDFHARTATYFILTARKPVQPA